MSVLHLTHTVLCNCTCEHASATRDKNLLAKLALSSSCPACAPKEASQKSSGANHLGGGSPDMLLPASRSASPPSPLSAPSILGFAAGNGCRSAAVSVRCTSVCSSAPKRAQREPKHATPMRCLPAQRAREPNQEIIAYIPQSITLQMYLHAGLKDPPKPPQDWPLHYGWRGCKWGQPRKLMHPSFLTLWILTEKLFPCLCAELMCLQAGYDGKKMKCCECAHRELHCRFY